MKILALFWCALECWYFEYSFYVLLSLCLSRLLCASRLSIKPVISVFSFLTLPHESFTIHHQDKGDLWCTRVHQRDGGWRRDGTNLPRWSSEKVRANPDNDLHPGETTVLRLTIDADGQRKPHEWVEECSTKQPDVVHEGRSALWSWRAMWIGAKMVAADKRKIRGIIDVLTAVLDPPRENELR